ncbi:CRISPR-associated endonuclease Cas9 [Paraliobacillus ryukyuensis]|uniref:CRISPR-associated endonuclease Cas9 n=1 Tax=Paraliobacillus ryukyuensis TaxID=200904 RepID=A0A366DZ60_9BACI|nr:type II CRISPR RNA-guided endonuclease Cas9 [Paraliobacillus ryukyuensis]RBO95390.1 CRISPR-associated Csn1 family endonuclease [Paraliobacillus ryukyuensis]
MNEPFVLGLDIGIGSVGWGMIDKDQNIIDAGVRLFPEADKSFNESRRSFRGARRLLRRRKHRIERVYQLLDRHEIWDKGTKVDHHSDNVTPYHIRMKGLTEPLTNKELTIALTHLAKRRGIHNINVIDEEDQGNELSTYEQIRQNQTLLETKYVCEVQVERLETEGEIRGHRNRFKTSDYVKEARQILETQQQSNEKVTDELIESYIDLLEKRREYFDGPGYGSEYGWEQDIKKWYEKMMGKCSYFPDELRVVKESHSAQLFNLLNDLNNLTLNREENTKLTQEEKELIIHNLFKQNKTVSLKKIAKILGVSEDDIKSFRVDTKGKPLFTSLSTYFEVKKITNKPAILEDREVLDQIAELITVYQSKQDIQQALEQNNLPLNDEELDQLSELNFNGTHSLSLRMINELLPDLWSSAKNQMQLITEKGYKPKDVDYEQKKYIPYYQIDDYILSPVVKRSFKQTVRIINEVIKKYGTPTEIVVELAREKNSDDKKKFLKELNKKNASINKQVKEKLDTLDVNPSKGLFNMLRLWHLQDGNCMYSLKEIPINDLMENPQNFEIDHIIPRSVSFDDSQNNKVLVRKEENQKKGNLTPFQYFQSNKATVSYEKFKAHVLQLAKTSQKMSRKKKEYLLEERDINKFNVQKDFINRNLVDTRYATREILNTLQQFFYANNQAVKVKSVNGGFTNYLRKLWDFNKDRGADYKHHAEDALIVAMANYIFEYKDAFKADHLIYANDNMIDTETGEILTEKQFNAAFTEKIHKIKAVKNYKGYKYSHKVDMKPNRQLMNDTLFSTREKDNKEYVVNKIKDIYNPDNEKLKKIMTKSPEDLLMYQHDRKTFENLKSIFEQYSEAKNPLYQYYKETEQHFTKYSKKGNGPVVKSIKYLGNAVNEHHDLSNKYNPKNKKVITLSIKPFRMDVYYEDGLYKFITVRYNDLKEMKNSYEIDNKRYEDKLKTRKIKSKDNFLFSLYKNDLMNFNDEELRLIGVNAEKRNTIEVNTVTYDYKDYCDRNNIKTNRLKKTISKNTKNFSKLATDVLGNKYLVENEKLKLKFEK